MNPWMAVVAVALLVMVDSVRAAPTLLWEASEGAQGYKLYLAPTANPQSVVTLDVGNVTTKDLAGQVAVGTQYEAWVTAYSTLANPYESGQSNHIRFTVDAAPQIITVPAAPTSLTIQFGTP